MKDTLNIAVAGLGTVGGGIVNLINDNHDLINKKTGKNVCLYAVSDLDASKCPPGVKFYKDALAMTADENVDIVVELIGGTGFAKDLVLSSIHNKKHVVTANKALLADFGNEIVREAEANSVSLGFEASVAGCIPIIHALKGEMASNNISQLFGIMNGTCNYILSTMEKTGRDFKEVLAEAQKLGYAEAEPSLDIDGHDTAHKLAILTSLAFHMPLNKKDIYVEGIRNISKYDIVYAKDLGYKIRLLGIARKLDSDNIAAYVFPCFVKNDTTVAAINGAYNYINVRGDFADDVSFIGRGAGASPTATAVMSDIMDIASETVSRPLIHSFNDLRSCRVQKMLDYEGTYYLRIRSVDRVGVLSKITNSLSANNISIESMIQRDVDADGYALVFFTLHKTKEANIQKVLDELEKTEEIVERPCIVRIVNLDG